MATTVVLIVLAASLAVELRRTRQLADSWKLMRHVRVRHVSSAAAGLAAVAATVVVLWTVPPLRWGWWSAIGGTGSAPTTGTTSASSPVSTALAVTIPLLICAVAPMLAAWEERMFRAGDEKRSPARRAGRALTFGMVHMTVGAPVAAGVALGALGGICSRSYLSGYRRAEQAARTVYDDTVRAQMVEIVHHRTEAEGTPLDGPVLVTTRTLVDGCCDEEIARLATEAGIAEATRTHAVYNLAVAAIVLVSVLG